MLTDAEKDEVLDFCKTVYLKGHKDVHFVGDGTESVFSENEVCQATNTLTETVLAALEKAKKAGTYKYTPPKPKATPEPAKA